MSYKKLRDVVNMKPRLEGYVFQSFTDGVQTWCRTNSDYHLERYVGFDKKVAKKRRKWCVVSRDGYDEDGLAPPIIAGPFPNFRVALTAYEIL